MADIDLHIGGHVYTLSCAEGEEADLLRLAAMVDGEISRARSLIGGMTEARQLLFAAIFLAERVTDGTTKNRPLPAADLASLAGLAERIEAVGSRLSSLASAGT